MTEWKCQREMQVSGPGNIERSINCMRPPIQPRQHEILILEFEILNARGCTIENMRAPGEPKMLNQEFVDELAVRVHLLLKFHKVL